METILKNKMQWKLRIPLILFLFGLTSGIQQSYPNLSLIQGNDLIVSIQYFGVMGLLIWFTEKNGINEMKVHFSIGILLIAAGILIDIIFN